MNIGARLLLAWLALAGPMTGFAQRYDAATQATQTPGYLDYMSGRCRSLKDTLRSANTRGLSYETRTSLQQEYQVDCAEEEAQAHQRVVQQRREQTQEKRDADRLQKIDRERALVRASVTVEQCREAKRVLVAKRARLDLTEGEKADLSRFEENFRSRCSQTTVDAMK